MGGQKSPDPVVAPPPPKVKLLVKVVDGFGRPLKDAEVEVVNLPGDPKKVSSAAGLTDFGLVDPRRKFDIKVRKTSFGPQGNPFQPGEARVVRHPNLKGPIVVTLTQNVARLRIRVLTPAPEEKPVVGAIIGVDGITGAAPLPQTDGNGNSQVFTLTPGAFRFHAQKNGFGPEPATGGKFQKDQEVVGLVTLVDGDFATEVIHLTRFVAQLTINVVSPPAPGGLPGPDVALDDADVGVDGQTGPGFLKTKNGGKVTLDVPAGQDFHIRARKNGFGKAVASGDVVNFSFDEGDVKALAENEQKEVTLRLMEAGQVTPVITPVPALPAGDPIVVLVKRPHTTPKRARVNFKSDTAFGGVGVVTMANPSGNVKVFRSATGTDEVAFDGKKEITLTTTAVTAGTDLFIEAAAATAKLADLKLTLELRGGSKFINPPVSINVTCVELKLDICKSRTSATTDPDPLSEADKINVGRFVHRQVNNKHGRAMLIVRKPVPADFAGTLVLKPVISAGGSNEVQLFDKDSEVAPGHAALANPFEFPATFDAATPQKFFAEGSSTSTNVRETGYTLGVKGVDEDQGDRVAMTVVSFSKLKADVPSTPAVTNRAGNSPVNRHEWKIADPAAGASDFDEDYATNKPFVLMENSVKPADQIKLTVAVQPAANVPVRWAVIRDRRPAPNGDHADLIALADNKEAPTLAHNNEKLDNTLLADAVGSFHICAYVDCNNNQKLDYMGNDGARIDREPFIMMNLVLVRVQGVSNDSAGQVLNCSSTPPVGQTAANFGGFTTSSAGGGPWTAANSGWHADATVDVIGGGNDGKRGLDHVFAGWIQHIFLNGIRVDYSVPGAPVAPPAPPAPTVPRSHQYAFISNLPDNTHFGRYHYIGATETPVNAADAGIVVTSVPTLDNHHIMDVSPFPAPGTGGDSAVGTNSAQGGTTGPHGGGYPVPMPRPLGERWQREMWDAPGIGCRRQHISQGGKLTNFRFNLGFRTDLCFWTSTDLKPDPTAAGVANRLYVSVYTCTWTPDFAIAFNPATGAGAVTTAAKIDITKAPSAANGRAVPVDGFDMETRAPFALAWYAVDART